MSVITPITHHGHAFLADTSDWSDEASAETALNALEWGVCNLSAEQVQRIVDHWSDPDAECASRNARDDVARMLEAIERDAFERAVADWDAYPDSGHNCTLTCQHLAG